MNPTTASVPPNRYSQYANALSRGNETSGAPIWSGTTKLANANTIGVAKNSNMIVPCIVNSWLYCSGDRNCMPGRASSARISSAIRPPAMKNAKDVTMYMIPICFASVVRRTCASADPRTCRRTGHGRACTGRGVTVVMATSMPDRVITVLRDVTPPPPGNRPRVPSLRIRMILETLDPDSPQRERGALGRYLDSLEWAAGLDG